MLVKMSRMQAMEDEESCPDAEKSPGVKRSLSAEIAAVTDEVAAA